MKGFGIEVKNNLLEQKHIFAMGEAVWLYMWCLDKMTSITEEGIGRVLGGKPIKYEVEVQPELGVSRSTYMRWLGKLRMGGYVNTIRTPYGVSISVNKAHKRFGRKTSDVSYVDERCVTSGTSNIRQYKDSNKRMFSPKAKTPLSGVSRKRMDDDVVFEETDEEGNPVRKSGWKSRPKKEGTNKVAIRICHRFADEVHKRFGWKPGMGVVEYKLALAAINKHGLTEDQVYDLFDEWFGLDKKDDELVQLTRAISTNQINSYKARNL